MVAGLFLVTRTTQGVDDDRNRVREVIIHADDASTNAQIIQSAVDGLNTAQPVTSGGEPIYETGYFDTVVQIGAAPAGILVTLTDFIAYPPVVASKTG